MAHADQIFTHESIPQACGRPVTQRLLVTGSRRGA
eukprot:COSAG02_NODE_53632_length_300_cov_1.228856_1_plen_34_part_10